MKIDLGTFGNVLKLIPLIVGAVKVVEGLFKDRPKSGAEKADVAISLVGDLLPVIEGAIDRDVVDDALVQSAIRQVMSAIVSLNNVVRDVQARKATTTPVPVPTP